MKKLFITDLDGTLYDWAEFFVPAFYAMAHVVAKETNTPLDKVLSEYMTLHQKYKNVEHPYTTLELPCVRAAFPALSGEALKERLNCAFHAFNSERKQRLCLFSGVKDTLCALNDAGVVVVGFTESGEENGYYRLCRLDVADAFKKVYVWDSAYDGHPKSPKTVRLNVKKPCGEVLRAICAAEGVDVGDAIYCGDSLTKDIYMAHSVSMECIRVRCAAQIAENYAALRAISHWTEGEYAADEEILRTMERENIKPDYEVYDFEKIRDIVLA